MKRIISLPIWIAFFAANSLIINELAAFVSSDSLPKPYRGYRLSLYDFRIESESKKAVSIQLNIVNTGRLPVIFSEKAAPPLELVVELDSAAVPPLFRGREAEIVAAVLAQKVNLAPGKFKTDAVVKLPFSKIEKAEKPPLAVAKKAEKPTEKATEKAEETVAEDTNIPKKTAEKSPRDKSAPDPQTPNPQSLKPDLVIDTAWVVKRAKKSALIALVIRNQGEATARIGGPSAKKQTDNLAVNAYFSSSKKLSRGAMLADGIFIDEAAGNGLLLPMERFSVEMDIPLDAQTRFTNFVILELDPFGTVDESDKTNNTRAVLSEKRQ